MVQNHLKCLKIFFSNQRARCAHALHEWTAVVQFCSVLLPFSLEHFALIWTKCPMDFIWHLFVLIKNQYKWMCVLWSAKDKHTKSTSVCSNSGNVTAILHPYQVKWVIGCDFKTYPPKKWNARIISASKHTNREKNLKTKNHNTALCLF